MVLQNECNVWNFWFVLKPKQIKFLGPLFTIKRNTGLKRKKLLKFVKTIMSNRGNRSHARQQERLQSYERLNIPCTNGKQHEKSDNQIWAGVSALQARESYCDQILEDDEKNIFN